MTDIKAALAKLDINNDNHWTEDGAPRVDTVRFVASNQSLTRDQITQAAPGFTRATALQPQPVLNPDGPVEDDKDDSAAPVLPVVTAPPAASAPTASEEQEPPVDALQRAKEDLQHAKANLEQARVLRDKVIAEFDALTAKVDKLQLAYEELEPKLKHDDAVQGYLASQRELLEQRAQKALFWRESGIDLKTLLPSKAPIDMAMARRNLRGGQRPSGR